MGEVPAAYPCWGKGRTRNWRDPYGLVYSSANSSPPPTVWMRGCFVLCGAGFEGPEPRGCMELGPG